MMSINENQANSELKGNIGIDTQITPVIQSGETTFKSEFDKMLDDSGSVDPSSFIGTMGFNPLLNFDYQTFGNFEDMDTYTIDTKTIDNKDAMFFLNISNSSMEPINVKLSDNQGAIDASNYKTMEVSKTLGDIIAKSIENNKSVRLDFDNQVTVVLKVSKEGKIDASFIPQDKQVENYLRNNIDYLKVRFDEQNIAYSNISYRPYRQNRNNRQQGGKNE